MTRYRVLSVLAAGAMACAVCSSAAAATSDEPTAVSENWAGYVAGGDTSNESAQPAFSQVSASWVQPTANCANGQGSSAFWVGLGGEDGQSDSLEQAGTEVDCSSSGSASYFAWYELLPAAPVRLGVTIKPGDHVSTSVGVNGTAVTITLTDNTTGNSATKNLQMDDPDVSSAEWIAEAPSLCDGSGDCQPVSLTDFGSVTFSNASATANGHTGTISDSQWGDQPVELGGASPEVSFGGGFGGDESAPGATPSSLSTAGSSFSVAWQGADSQSATQGSTAPTGGGSGYPGSGGYGLGGGSASGGGYPGYGVDPGSGGGGYGGYGGGGYGGGGYGGYGYGGGGYSSGGGDGDSSGGYGGAGYGAYGGYGGYGGGYGGGGYGAYGGYGD